MLSRCFPLAMLFVCLSTLALGADAQEALFELPASAVPTAVAGAPPQQAPRPRSVAAATPDPRQELLRAKLAERDRLSAEIEALRNATKSPEMIAVSVEVLEVSLTNMRRLGLKVPPVAALGVQAEDVQPASYSLGSTHAVDEPYAPPGLLPAQASNSLDELIDRLKQANVAKTLANPRMMTTIGRPAAFHVGGQLPLPPVPGGEAGVDFLEFGTRLDVLAESLGNREVRVDVRLRMTEVDESRPAFAIDFDRRRIPVLQGQECMTTCTTTLGEAALLCWDVAKRTEASVREDGRVVETTNDVACWTILRVDDAVKFANANVEIAEPPAPAAPYTAPPVMRHD